MKKLVVIFAMFLTVAAFAAVGDEGTVINVGQGMKVTVMNADGSTKVAIVVGQSVQVGERVMEIGGGRVVRSH